MSGLIKTVAICLALGAVGLASAPVYAQGGIDNQNKPRQKPAVPAFSELPEFHYLPENPPVFEKVTYKKLEPPLHLQERIERLTQGIKVDIPPEYDHYGYEIRRYMAGVAGINVIAAPKNIEGQLENIKNAEIILKYWREAHAQEAKEIEAEIERSNASSSTRSLFKYHRGVSQAFFVEAASWMNNNRALLEFLDEIGPRAYKVREGKIIFGAEKDLRKFASILESQQTALKLIREYTPFRMMVY